MSINKIEYIEFNDYVEGIMPDGQIFVIDKDDYEKVSTNYWHYCTGYLRSTKIGLMHRFLIGAKPDEEVDHRNKNRLFNRKSNLRIVTRQENMNNKSIYKTNKSGYPGIKWNKPLNKWQAQITINKKRIHLGVFEKLQDAIVARRLAEKQLIS